MLGAMMQQVEQPACNSACHHIALILLFRRDPPPLHATGPRPAPRWLRPPAAGHDPQRSAPPDAGSTHAVRAGLNPANFALVSHPPQDRLGLLAERDGVAAAGPPGRRVLRDPGAAAGQRAAAPDWRQPLPARARARLPGCARLAGGVLPRGRGHRREAVRVTPREFAVWQTEGLIAHMQGPGLMAWQTAVIRCLSPIPQPTYTSHMHQKSRSVQDMFQTRIGDLAMLCTR